MKRSFPLKIALCLSGQPRSFAKGFEYHKKNLLDHYDVDTFIHTWYCDDAKDYIGLYEPVLSFLEKPLEGNFDEMYKNTPDAINHPPRFTVSMLYSIEKSCELKVRKELQSKKKYDWVIKSRPDYALNTLINFYELDSNKLYIPNCRMVPEKDFGNDQFAFSSSNIMNKRMTIYSNMNHHYDQGVPMIGEDMMKAQLHQYGLHGEFLEYVNMNNPFSPGEFNGTWHSLIRDDCGEWKKR
tara:strand:+ start:10199 stop:10915 length:717 start_codon:yes stop_codon:yes gene_type:complete